MSWPQVYDPFGNVVLSTALAALPMLVLLGSLGIFRIKAHYAAILGLSTSLIVAITVFRMPAGMSLASAGYGAAYGLFPIGWIVLNVIFLYQLTNECGLFERLRHSITGLTEDRRLQLLLVAFSFGAFIEGACGFGTPVAVTGAILIGLGFTPLSASGLSLIANTAPVAFGALGAPLIGLQGVTGLDIKQLSAMVGRQLPFFSLIVPFWLIWAFAGFRGMLEIWPAILVAGVSFAIPQFLVSNLHGPWLVDVVAAIVSIATLTTFLRFWQPKHIWRFEVGTGSGPESPRGLPAWGGGSEGVGDAEESVSDARPSGRAPSYDALAHPRASDTIRVWLPWIILSIVVFVWGLPQTKAFLDGIAAPKIPVYGLDKLVLRVPPVVAKPAAENAVFNFNFLSASGSGILLASIIGGLTMGYSFRGLLRVYWKTLKLVRYSLLTIAAMMAVGFTTRYSGMDATLGLAFARTGWLYPFFGAMLGWLGVALTGSDTSSNVLFGSLQKITATQLGLSPILMGAANSSGGVMGKMIDAQSIVVASTATRWYGHEGDILRYVFFHSLVLAGLVGVLVLLQAYVFSWMIVR
ncbi:MAG: lactate permease [Blastocatellia bacterium]|jgi:lactate permease|nr:lactate permease [Blastocatellia bacterium]